MKISLTDIPPEGLTLTWAEGTEGELEAPKGSLEEDITFTSGPKGTVFLKVTPKGLIVKGDLECAVYLHCARCLKGFEMPIKESFELVYLMPKDAPHEEEVRLSSDEMDVAFLEGDIFDLDQLLSERVWLSIPMKPLCRENCKGLCPICGKDLNEGQCECRQERIDPRFEALKALKLKLTR